MNLTTVTYAQALVYCHRFKSNYLHPMKFLVYEDDGITRPLQTVGCSRSSVGFPCSACIRHVVFEVSRSLPLPNRSSIEIYPPSAILKNEGVV